MDGVVCALSYELAVSTDGVPPSSFRIFQFGVNKTLNGDYTFDAESADAIIKNAVEYGNKMVVDYEHQTLNSEDNGQPAPAAARFDLELRGDGLYAVNVQWTPRATEYLKNKEYLYYSPTFIPDDKGRPKRLLPVALTNLPATKNMTPLVAAKAAPVIALKVARNLEPAPALEAVPGFALGRIKGAHRG